MKYDIGARHGVVVRRADDKFGYFGFPGIIKLSDGRLLVGASGLRLHHVCPFGKTILAGKH